MMDVTPDKLKEELDKDTAMQIVSVQTPDAFRHAHLPAAISIPAETFEADYPRSLKDTDQVIVVYGEYDENGRSQNAAGVLELAGYTKVGWLVGGLMAWMEGGHQVEGGQDS